MLVPICLIMAGCGGSGQGSAATSSPTSIAAQANGLQVVVASSDLALGRNRFTFGLLDNDHPIDPARPLVTFYRIEKGDVGVPMGSQRAVFNDFARGLANTAANSAALAIQGVYVSHPTFTHAGPWAIEVRFTYGGRTRVIRSPQPFVVTTHSVTPAVGSPAPRSNNPTVAQEPVSKLDSGSPPDDMHALSIAQAIARHKPLVVLFATAAYCTSRMCGPEIEVVQGLERRYRGRVNFVHIEIYQDARPPRFAPAVLQWHLQTEPWVFVVDRRGTITAKFEGPTPASEIEPAIRADLRES